VQLYISDVAATVPVPLRSLAGMQRLSLRAGEKRQVSFTLTPGQMSLIDDQGQRVVEPGEFLISVGGRPAGFAPNGAGDSSNVLTGRFSVTGKTVLTR